MDRRQSLDDSPELRAARTVPSGSNGANAPPSQSVLSENLPENSPVVAAVLKSDIALTTCLTRLKQSIASVREFASFLKKRSLLEEEQAQGLKKLCRTSHDSSRRPENRQGSYVQQYDEVIQVHDRMADNGLQFALSLHQMHEDLQELAANMERGRKLWKQNGMAAEKKVQDSEALMEKAKSKYHSLADDYDRARTGDKTAGRVFGIKGPKSAAQHEEDLQRKVQQADSDYSAKVQTAQQQRLELVNSLRPQAVRALQEQINECDNSLTFQLQKFATLNERLLLGNGLCVSPLQAQQSGSSPKSLREIVARIDNGKDFANYVTSFSSKAGAGSDIKYERHPTLASGPSAMPPSNYKTAASLATPSAAAGPHAAINSQASGPSSLGSGPPSIGLPSLPMENGAPLMSDESREMPKPSGFDGGPPNAGSQCALPPLQPPAVAGLGTSHGNNSTTSLPPLRPVFGLALDELLQRDGLAIPLVVYQCIQAVDLFGLEIEGVYRLSGSAAHVSRLKSLFDNDSTAVDFRNPDAFFDDVNSVTGLLKQFLRDMPDPLLTREHYQAFIEAARIDDDMARRDNIHATINALPDPNYATLRALILHLNRVQEHASNNRMTAGNLAIIFGPTLMGTGPNVADAGWQVRVIDTILQNTYQIFDDD